MAVDFSGLRDQLLFGSLAVVDLATPYMLNNLEGVVWDWDTGGDRSPFPPHIELNGSFGLSQAAFGGYFPGDHNGCRCTLPDVGETARIVGSAIAGKGAVSEVIFAEQLDTQSQQTFSIDAGFGSRLNVTVPSSGEGGGWPDLINQLYLKWPEACQHAIDMGALRE